MATVTVNYITPSYMLYLLIRRKKVNNFPKKLFASTFMLFANNTIGIGFSVKLYEVEKPLIQKYMARLNEE